MARRALDPSVEPLSFICYRLVPIYDPGPGEGAYASVQLMQTSNAMGAFMHPR